MMQTLFQALEAEGLEGPGSTNGVDEIEQGALGGPGGADADTPREADAT
jgi:hypothetical protein